MWIIFIVASSLLNARIVGSLNTSISYCSALDKYYEERTRSVLPLHGRLRYVMVAGTAQYVEVRGGRGAARAAAALLYVIIRYGLRYNTKLVTEDSYLCDFGNRSWEKSAIVAPTAFWPPTGCRDNAVIDRFTTLRKPAVNSDLLLYMHLANNYDESCKHYKTWTYEIYSNATKYCNFATTLKIGNNNSSCHECKAILASKEYKNKVNLMEKYEKQIDTQRLQLKIIFFDNDLQLRRAMKSMKEKNESFLFIYDNLWSDVNGTYEIELAPYNKRKENISDENTLHSILIGDGNFISSYAPDIKNTISSFMPNTSTLQQILEIEDKLSIYEAACMWANGSQSEFEKLLNLDDTIKNFSILLIVCDKTEQNNIRVMRDHIKQYVNNASKTSKISFDLQKCDSFTDCNNIIQLELCLRFLVDHKSIIGAVLSTWTDKIVPVDNAAENNGVFLTFADPVSSDVELKNCRSASGNLFELAQAYHKFFRGSKWNRISIISDITDYSQSFTNALKSLGYIVWKEVLTNEGKIYDTLNELKNLDARIFILNLPWNLSKEILCAAIKIGLTSTQFVWIARNREILECDGQVVHNFKHISIGLEWQGGIAPNNSSLFSRDKWIQLFNTTNNKTQQSPDSEWDDFNLPKSVYFMAKAIIRLSQAFTFFRNKHFDLTNDIHDFKKVNSTRLISKYFDDTVSINGSIVFVNEWLGNKRRSLAVWRIEKNDVFDTWLAEENLFKDFNKISDGTSSCMIKSGDPFAPRCHDIAVILSVILVILLIVGLVIARRLRLARLAQKDLSLLNAVSSHREQIASSLDRYLVERHMIKVLHEIGSGCFGRVHFAELLRPGSNAVVVAAKEPHNLISLEDERDFLYEASVLAQLDHDHIIQLIGVCINDGPPMVLMEHALYLDLRRYLTERRYYALKMSTKALKITTFDDISDVSLTLFVRQAAAALEYLASKRLVHRDIRAANCLIDKNRSLKLADFGMARPLNKTDSEYASNRRALFPVLYMAPESLDEGVFSPASDVWALGVLMLEVVTLGSRPYGAWPLTRVVRHVSLGGHAPLPPDASIHTRNLAMACWKRNPEDRPSASEIQNYLTMNPQALSAALLSPNPITEY